jgi:hypothetical protein
MVITLMQASAVRGCRGRLFSQFRAVMGILLLAIPSHHQVAGFAFRLSSVAAIGTLE